MDTQVNSINQNGCSVCKAGEEKYTKFRPAHRPNQILYQYDYRRKNGELFSTVAPTLEQCRTKRDKWVQAKNYKSLSPYILEKIQKNRKLTNNEMVYYISLIKPRFGFMDDWYCFSHEEIVSTFNLMFGTEIKEDLTN